MREVPRSHAVSDHKSPSITAEDQSRGVLSPGFQLAPMAASASGKQRPELQHESGPLFQGLAPFRLNTPPLFPRSAAHGLSQAVKRSGHEIVPRQRPLLIDAATSRIVSRNTDDAHSANCKYCGHGGTRHADGVATSCSSDQACDDQVDDDKSGEPDTGETKTVREIVEVMESLGPGVLEGSVFSPANASDTDAVDKQSTMRQAVIPYLRMLEAQTAASNGDFVNQSDDESVSSETEPRNPWYDIDTSEPPRIVTRIDSAESNRIESRIDTLRSSAEQLDGIANQLERRDLYYQSDRLRELASQIRADARNARIALMAQPSPEIESVTEPLDFGPVTRGGRENIQAQLEQLLEAMQSEHRVLRR